MKSRPRSLHSLGFSLVELLVVVAIFLIITSIVLFNQNKFSSNISIQNLAYQIALSVRQAQVYGLSVRGSNSNGADTFDTAFGVHFDKSFDGNKFLFFADNNLDKRYDAKDDMLISTFNIDSGTISNVCTIDVEENELCFIDSSGGGNDIDFADVTFKRPNPEGIITDDTSTPESTDKSQIEIIVQSVLKDRYQTIVVTKAGQIYVESQSQSQPSNDN